MCCRRSCIQGRRADEMLDRRRLHRQKTTWGRNGQYNHAFRSRIAESAGEKAIHRRRLHSSELLPVGGSGSAAASLPFVPASRLVAHVWERTDAAAAERYRLGSGCVKEPWSLMKLFLDWPIPTETWPAKKQILTRFIREVPKRDHNAYVLKYILCEVFACLALVSSSWSKICAITQAFFYRFWTCTSWTRSSTNSGRNTARQCLRCFSTKT